MYTLTISEVLFLNQVKSDLGSLVLFQIYGAYSKKPLCKLWEDEVGLVPPLGNCFCISGYHCYAE